MIRRISGFLDSLIWPRGFMCLCCESRADTGLLCEVCSRELQTLLLHGQDGDVRSVWAYQGSAKRLVVGLKDECIEDCAVIMADAMARMADDMQLPPDTVLTWVTMPETRRRERGIDHGQALCTRIASQLGLQSEQLLIRSKKGHTQRGLNAEQRQRNMEGVFTCRKALQCPVLLIDDVMTTGATARACKDALMKAGATHVYVLTATCVIR